MKREGFEDNDDKNAADSHLDISTAPTQMEFWASNRKDLNRLESETSPEQESLTLDTSWHRCVNLGVLAAV